MKRTGFIIFLIFSVISIIYRPCDVFAQGREWQRLRAGALPADVTSIPTVTFPIEYFITIGDQIEVFVWQNPDLSRDVTVGPDGKISYPLVGRLKVTGLSIEQLEKRISEGLAKYIRAPQVSIMMKQYSGEKIIILGEVNYPGIYTYIGRIDLIEALAMAGDFTEDAREDSVIVVRGNLTEAPVAQRINVARILRGKTLKEQLTLVPNDVIYVPRSFIANVNKFLDNIWPTISRTRDAIGLKRDLEEEF